MWSRITGRVCINLTFHIQTEPSFFISISDPSKSTEKTEDKKIYTEGLEKGLLRKGLDGWSCFSWCQHWLSRHLYFFLIPGGLSGKESICHYRRHGFDLWVGQEDPLQEEMATHSSILDQRIPLTEEPGGLQSTGSQRVRHDWAHSHLAYHINCAMTHHLFNWWF